MQHRIFHIIFISISLFIPQNHLSSANSTQQIKKERLILNEIQKCLYLEKQLLPDKPTITFKQKLIKIALQVTIPTITSIVICKIINKIFGIYLKKTNSKVKGILFDHATTIKTNSVPNLNANLNKEGFKRNALLFSALFISTYFITKFFMREKEPTDLQRLTNFIKDWTNNKTQIPKIFQKQLEPFYSDYVKNNKLSITELQATRIVFQIISQIIEYKTSLPQNTHLFTKI